MDKSLFSQSGEIKGKQKEGYFTFNFQHSPGEEELAQLRGTLYALIGLPSHEKEKAEQLASQIFTNFENTYFEASGNNLRALEEALEVFKNTVKDLGLEAEIVVSVLWGSVSYIGKVGGGSVVLVRKKQVKEIDFSKVASGALGNKDELLLLDSELTKSLTLADLPEKIKEDFEESVKSINEDRKDKEGTGLIIRLTIQEPLDKPQELIVADLDKESKTDSSQEGAGRKASILAFLAPVRRWAKEKVDRASPGLKESTVKGLDKLKQETKKGIDWIVSAWKPRGPGEIGDADHRKRKRIIQIAGVLIIIFVVSVVFGIVNHQINQEKQRVQEGIAQVNANFDEAGNLKEINPAKAADLVLEAEEILNDLPEDNDEINALRDRLSTLLAEINKIYPAESSVLADLTLVKGNIQAKKLKKLGSNIYVLDTETGSVIKVNTGGGDPQVFVADKVGLKNIALTDQYLYLQFDGSIERFGLGNSSENSVAQSSASWQELIDASTFSDNLYLLDAEAGQIWKYVPVGNAISGPQNYFPVRFESKPTAFAIDGFIYISSERDIFKYNAGESQNYQAQNLPRAFGRISAIYTDESAKNLYILDQENGAIVVLSKQNGEYQGMYEDANLRSSASLVVNEPTKKAYFLVGNTVHQVNLR